MKKEDRQSERYLDPLTNDITQEYDPVNSEIDFASLQQAMDTSWGRSSTPRTAQHSVKFQIEGSNRLVASYCAIVNFVSERQMIEQKRRYSDEGSTVVNAHVKFIKERYKAINGGSLKVNEVSAHDSIEIIGLNCYNPKRTAYMRKKIVFEITG
jgi:hypothetical protein